MSTTKSTCIHHAMSTGGKPPTKPILPVHTDSEHEDEGEPALVPVRSTWGRGCGRGRGRGRGMPSTRATVARATKKKAMSDSDAGDDPADVKASNCPSEEDADEVASMHTPSKCGPKAKPKDVEDADMVPVKRGRGRPSKAKSVKSPEVVPSDEEDGAIVPKARSNTKHQRTSVKKESDDEVNLEDLSMQKTPKKQVTYSPWRDT
ncbi:hypothetical protein V8D89_012083 [Ganoderma adspersum]